MKKSVAWFLSAIISAIITATVFIYQLYVNWGIRYFEVNFSFSGMILPFIVFFFFAWLMVRLILLGIQKHREYKALPEEEKQRRRNEALKAQQEYVAAQNKIADDIANRPPPTPRCAKCGSESLSADKKGFGVGKAVVGAALTGGIGLTAGNIGAKRVRITCLNCGHQWMAGKG